MSCVFQETPLSWSCLVAANHLTGHRQNKPSHWSFYMMILWTQYSICISCQRKGYHHAADLLITRGRKEQPETKRKEAGSNKMALPPSLTTRVGSPGTQGGRTEPIPASCPLTTCKQWNICAYTQDKNKSKCVFKKKKKTTCSSGTQQAHPLTFEWQEEAKVVKQNRADYSVPCGI